MAKEVQKPYEEVASEKGGQAGFSHAHRRGRAETTEGRLSRTLRSSARLCPSETELGGILKIPNDGTSHRSPQSHSDTHLLLSQDRLPTSTWGGTAHVP